MTDPVSFLQAIQAQPGDDTPRLIFADWLEENGDAARAEFIRVQCQLGNLLADDPARKPLHKREKELLNLHAMEWLPNDPPPARVSWSFERGLLLVDVSDLHTASDPWCRELALVFQRRPGATQLRLENLRAWGWLAGQEWLEQLTTLRLARFWQSYPPSTLRRLVRSPHLAGLGILECHLSDRGHSVTHAFLDEAKHLQKLTRLKLTHCQLQANDLQELVTSPIVDQITHLDLRMNQPGSKGIKHLVASSGVKSIRNLDLGSCGLQGAIIEHIISSPYLENLFALGLNNNFLGPDEARLLAQAKTLGNLKHLLLLGNQFGTAGIRMLLESDTLPQLESLDLSDNLVSSEEKKDLRRLLRERFGKRATAMLL